MRERIRKIAPYIFLVIALMLFIYGFYSFINVRDIIYSLSIETKVSIVISYALSLFSISLGFISIFIAFISINMSYDSDKRMKTIAEDTFLSIAGTLEDRRMNLKNTRTKLINNSLFPFSSVHMIQQCSSDRTEYINNLSFSIWKCLTDLRRIDLFKIYMKRGKHLEKHQKRIIKYTMHYFEELIVGRNYLNMNISDEYKNQIFEMYSIIADFEIYKTLWYINESYENVPVNNYIYELMLELQR